MLVALSSLTWLLLSSVCLSPEDVPLSVLASSVCGGHDDQLPVPIEEYTL